MGLSFWHIIIVLLVVLVIFGAGKLPNVMGDLGKGIKSFKAGLNDDKVADASMAKPDPEKLPNQKTDDGGQKTDV
jgi:sec-independent protein translocase protein TatA